MKNKVYALVDCNNFFVSCERVFNPALKDIPVVVLSNNDGVIVARSNEAKEIGIGMAEPFYKCKSKLDRYNAKVLSANFTLYADLSRRVMEILEGFSDKVEIYSIDEAFLEFSSNQNLERLGREIKETIYKWTGLPVSVGFGSTKTLSKIANEISKKDKSLEGVLDLTSKTESELDNLLKTVPVKNIWGIGFRTAPKLKKIGVTTAHNFKYMNDKWVKKNMNITGWRTQQELKGVSILELETMRPSQKSIASTRSFGDYVTDIEKLKSAVSRYVTIAGKKLRSQDLVAGSITVYIRTNYHRKDLKQYSNYAVINLTQVTSYTPKLVSKAIEGLEGIFKDGYEYKKAGIILNNLTHKDDMQVGMFGSVEKVEKDKEIMKAIDYLNNRWGGKVKLAGDDILSNKKEKREFVTPAYTTRWNDLLVVEM